MKNPYDEANREAAWIILSHPDRSAGLPLEWAKLWLAHPDPAGKAGRIVDEHSLTSNQGERQVNLSDINRKKRGYYDGTPEDDRYPQR